MKVSGLTSETLLAGLATCRADQFESQSVMYQARVPVAVIMASGVKSDSTDYSVLRILCPSVTLNRV
jgi:hypothetical protein